MFPITFLITLNDWEPDSFSIFNSAAFLGLPKYARFYWLRTDPVVLNLTTILLTLRWSAGVLKHPKKSSLSYKSTNRCKHNTTKGTNRMPHVFKAPGDQRKVNSHGCRRTTNIVVLTKLSLCCHNWICCLIELNNLDFSQCRIHIFTISYSMISLI